MAKPKQVEHWALKAPIGSHFRPATCEEVNCDDYTHGWDTLIPPTLPGQQLVAMIREVYQPGQYTVTQDELGGTVYRFAAGTPCLRRVRHRIRSERDYLYLAGNHGFVPSDEWADRLNDRLDPYR